MPIKKIGKGFNFPAKVKQWRKMNRNLPRVIANDSLNHFLQGFRNGGGQTDAGRWRKRKLRIRDFTSKSKKVKARVRKQAGRAVLVDTGALRRDVRVRRTTIKSIVIGTQSIAYARRHNEGLTDKLGRKMPKREFLGDSRKLDKKNVKTILRKINKIMK